jgi:AraC family transcriptional activator of pobA
MKLAITDKKTGGDLLLISGEKDFDRLFYSRDKEKKYFTIAWNNGPLRIMEHDTKRSVL